MDLPDLLGGIDLRLGPSEFNIEIYDVDVLLLQLLDILA